MTDVLTTTFLPATFSIPPSRMRLIAEEVARKHGLTLAELKADTHRHKVAHARHEAMWRMRRETTNSTTKIGQFFGRHHATVIEGCKAHVRRSDCS